MSTSYGVWCNDCNTGYMTDMHYSHVIGALVIQRELIARIVELVNELNTMPSLLVDLHCDEVDGYDFEHLTSFIAEHHAHDICVRDEYDQRWIQFYLSQQVDAEV